jgi:hypothetical protein
MDPAQQLRRDFFPKSQHLHLNNKIEIIKNVQILYIYN